jgi:glutamyl-tRNA(Gln) amidotransferase subunit E
MKIGFEIHQQLDSHKLFCKSPSNLREEEAEFEVQRRLRPTQSELGVVDDAAMKEFLKGKDFVYMGYNDSICLVELDEEPPHGPNEDAVETALTMALLLNARVVDEIHFMRKVVIDGSNTSGFQRTAIIAFDGYLDTTEGRVRIPTICLEEEACRKISGDEHTTTYNLDRLGIPLVEITTEPDIKSPQQARDAALKVGELLRATGRVKRGIGTIRQDVNVSIPGGARAEIKGVQDLNTIPRLIENEVARQKGLIRSKGELENRGVSDLSIGGSGVEDVTDIFKNTDSKIIKSQMKKGMVLGIKLQGFNGLLGGGLLGREIASYVKVHSGMKGIFHSDELPAYGITEDDVLNVKNRLSLEANDAFVIISGDREICDKARIILLNRASYAIKTFEHKMTKEKSKGIPYETRMARDTISEYMRPLPGAARMYPETDILPYVVSEELLSRLQANLPETYEEREPRLVKEFNLSEEQAYQIARFPEPFLNAFEETTSKLKSLSPTATASIFQEWVKDANTGKIEPKSVSMFVLNVDKGNISKEASSAVREKLLKGVTLEDALKWIGGEGVDLDAIVDRVISDKADFIRKKGEFAVKPIMGLVMKEARGRVDGKRVNEIVKKKIEEFFAL